MASINDVAKKAKVSKSTVSLVINKNGYVSEQTRERVEKAIEELGYTPSRLAQGLSKRHSGLVAVVVPDVAHPYFSTLVKSIEQRLAVREYMTIVCSAKENEATERWYVDMLNRKIVDGIITAGHTIDQEAYRDSGRPIVSVDRYISDSIPIVQADHEQAALLAGQLLCEAGCKRVAHFVGTPGIDVQSHRFNQALEEYLEKSGIEAVQVYVGHNAFRFSEYEQCARNFFESAEPVDAIVGVDALILACLQQAYERKIPVPEKLKMISYDGTYITRLHTPVITAIVQPIEEIGIRAADRIVERINGNENGGGKEVLPVFVQRGETCVKVPK